MPIAMGKGEKNREPSEGNETKVKVEDDLDALFKLPLTEFIVARNALASRLKKAGSGGEAERVKALVKPSISAWAVNQLYWKHRDAFNGLIAAGDRVRQEQAAQLAGQSAEMRGRLAARREALSTLSRLAGAVLRDAGHNPTPETMRRINTTLDALSTRSSLSDGPAPGRLADDVDPPGFESLVGLIPSSGRTDPDQPTPAIPSKSALQAAEEALLETRTIAQDAVGALQKATQYANETEKDRREAEKRFERANAAAEEARRRLQTVAAEAENAARALEDAERRVHEARKQV